MQINSRCRERAEGRKSRRRTYRCRQCHLKFQVDTLRPLPERDRVCRICKPEYPYPFVDKQTGEETQISATSAEVSTLRAWKQNRNLTFRVT